MGAEQRRGSTRFHPVGQMRCQQTGAFIVDRNGMVLGFDEGMEALTGWNAVSLVGRKNRTQLPLGDPTLRTIEPRLPLFEGTIEIPRESKTDLLRIHCSDGRTLDVEASIQRMAGQGHRAYVSVLRTIASSVTERELQADETLDPLTGVMQSDPFVLRLEKEVAKAVIDANPMAIVLADIDHLRSINDNLGYEAGNTVLSKVADILRVAATEHGILGRLEDDNFAILLPGHGRGDARQLAARVRLNVEKYKFFPEKKWVGKITLSLGAASFPADALNPNALLGRANEALDEARALGRNRVWCYLRRPRVPVQVPIYFEGSENLLVGYTRDLSPSGVFVQTSAPIDIGMRCALNFPLPGQNNHVHVIGKVVRAVPPEMSPVTTPEIRIPGMGVEFEQFGGPEDQLAIDTFLHDREATTYRPEAGPLSF